MNQDHGFSQDVHAYLDGDRDLLTDGDARAAADRFSEAITAYTDGLEVPGREVDRAVMAVVREQQHSAARRRSVWRWFVQPQEFRVRPALGTAALLVVVAAATWLVRWRDAGLETPEHTAQPTAPATVLVRFEFPAPEARSVSLAGSFNDWNGEATPLVKNPATSVWSVTVRLAPGEHQYLFVIDAEQWVADPRAHAQVDDGFGQKNSVLTVGPQGVVRS